MKHILTPKDHEYLTGQLKELEKETKVLAKKLGAATAYGGSFQIPEYMSIEERLRAINERDETIRNILSKSEVIPFGKINDKNIGFYCLIKTKNQETGSKENFYIINPELIDNIKLSENTMPVSPKSIVGQALMGKKSGNMIKIKLPKETKTLKIIDFEKKEY